ncbi:hypothetical protein [Undibacterium sp. Tian12W]|uniref:hypothetical protein n=1 Tax=Undibacterium sp. Tian12W TaxID=3413054 RepID=UPI003BF0AC63
MNNTALLNEIASSFQVVPMPSKGALSVHQGDCPQCAYLRNYLEEQRDRKITRDVIRYLHNELSCLSTAGLKWILPHYLEFCLTPEAEYSKLETEFLIYHLGPELKFQHEAKAQLSCLHQKQIDCLVHFLEWCEIHPSWSEYCPDDIQRALNFMRTLL